MYEDGFKELLVACIMGSVNDLRDAYKKARKGSRNFKVMDTIRKEEEFLTSSIMIDYMFTSVTGKDIIKQVRKETRYEC